MPANSPADQPDEIQPNPPSHHSNPKKKAPRARVEDLDPASVFTCTYENCTKQFAKKYNLKIHERRHAGQLPFHCDHPQCSKRFMWRSSFLRHLRSHQPKPGGRKRRSRPVKLDPSARESALPTITKLSNRTSIVHLNDLRVVADELDSKTVNILNALLVLSCDGPVVPKLRYLSSEPSAKRDETSLESVQAENMLAANQVPEKEIQPVVDADIQIHDIDVDHDPCFDELGDEFLHPYDRMEQLLHD